MLSTALAHCHAGEDVEVAQIDGDSEIAMRLREIGLIQGARLRVLRSGSPMIIQIGNSRFCLRGAEAALVAVRSALPRGLPGPALSVAGADE